MIITRKINGTETKIELTPEEIRKAANEYETECYMEDIRYRYEADGLGLKRLQELAEEWRNILDDSDSYWEAYWEALRYVMSEANIAERDEYLY